MHQRVFRWEVGLPRGYRREKPLAIDHANWRLRINGEAANLGARFSFGLRIA